MYRGRVKTLPLFLPVFTDIYFYKVCVNETVKQPVFPFTNYIFGFL